MNNLGVIRLILAPYLATKLLIFGAATLYLWSTSHGVGLPTFSEIASGFVFWDSAHYLEIANSGYPNVLDYHDAFFPGYPVLINLAMILLRDPILSGLFISAAASFLALFFIAKLVLYERDQAQARTAVWLVALWPMAIFMSLIYTESCFIAAAAACLYFARKGDFAYAALAGALASCFRITAVALLIPLLIEGWQQRRRLNWRLLYIAAIPIPIALYAVYMQIHIGDAWAFVHAQSLPSFNHHLDWPWTGASTIWGSVFGGSATSTTYVFALELIFGMGGAMVCLLLWLDRKFPLSLSAYCTAIWLIATSLSFWLSVPRYELAMFPAVIALADILHSRLQVRTAIMAVSAGFLGYSAMVFTSGRWLG